MHREHFRTHTPFLFALFHLDVLFSYSLQSGKPGLLQLHLSPENEESGQLLLRLEPEEQECNV